MTAYTNGGSPARGRPHTVEAPESEANQSAEGTRCISLVLGLFTRIGRAGAGIADARMFEGY